jgi:hypothetical protein
VSLPPITVRLLPGTDAAVLDNLVNVRPVTKGPAALQIDLAHKHILNGQGQIVVMSARNNPISLQGTVDKWRYAAAFGTLAVAHQQPMHTDWGTSGPRTGPLPALYDGETVTFVITSISTARQLVVFAFDASGTLNLLYATGSGAGRRTGDTVYIEAVASAPFGVDHIVAISAADPDRMGALAAWIAESARARGMLDTQGSILEQIAMLRDVRVGLISLYTCHSRTDCSR